MLVYHADPQRIRHFRGGNAYLFTAKEDFSRGGGLRTIQNLHDGGFSRTVFACNGMNLPFIQRKIHMIIGQNTVGIAHGDVFHP